MKNEGINKSSSNENILETSEKLRWKVGENLNDSLMKLIYKDASNISYHSVYREGEKRKYDFDTLLDKIITSRLFGFPIMFLLLMLVFWITIVGANYPSSLIANVLVDKLHPLLKELTMAIHLPNFLIGLLIDGGYLAMAWVISVMLPPMAIFFPLFTFLEDFGYLPRVAFNMDNIFRKVGAHGKQALTMTMGFGCNAAAIISTRIIDSPRERLIAIITNNFSLCNGRWPTQILIATIFIGGLVPAHLAGIVSAGTVVGITVLGVLFSLVVSYGLSRTILKGEASTFSLELPPFRPPKILQILYTSLIDRTLFVLWRAIVFAFPAGMIIWLVANVQISNVSIAEYFINWVDPFTFAVGLNGVILLAYIIAIPANEIVIPTVLMLTVLTNHLSGVGSGTGVLFDTESVQQISDLLKTGGWTLLTGINLMLFSLVHNPCSTTIYTIYKETKSLKWTLIATFLPIIMGFIICFITAQIYYWLI